jgi:hypothetical protein
VQPSSVKCHCHCHCHVLSWGQQSTPTWVSACRVATPFRTKRRC